MRIESGLVIAALALGACSSEPEAPAITWAQYQQIVPGISYAQVKAITRQSGKQVGANEVDGQMVRTYDFGNGSCLIMFAGDTVISKSTVSIMPPPL